MILSFGTKSFKPYFGRNLLHAEISANRSRHVTALSFSHWAKLAYRNFPTPNFLLGLGPDHLNISVKVILVIR